MGMEGWIAGPPLGPGLVSAVRPKRSLCRQSTLTMTSGAVGTAVAVP